MKMKFVALLHYTIDDPDGSRLGLLAKERINEKDKTFTYSVFFNPARYYIKDKNDEISNYSNRIIAYDDDDYTYYEL